MERNAQANRNERSRVSVLISLGLLLFSAQAFAVDLQVCSQCSYKTITEAVVAAKPKSRIIVNSGVYREHAIKIQKALVLQANGDVTIDGENAGEHIIEVLSPDVKINGFIITNTGSSYLQELSGIRVKQTDRCEISENQFKNATYGVYLENSKNCLVRDNIFRGTAQDESSGGNGIHLWQGENIVIENNDIQGHRDGIYFEFVKNAAVRANVVTKNIRYGLHFMSSNNCEYLNNTFINNGAGVAVMYSRKIMMTDNRFVYNRGVAAYGLLLKEIHEGQIERNKFDDNTVGIFMEGSNRNNFRQNLFVANGWALRIMGDCENNKFSNNDFIRNTFDVATNSENNPNEFADNYWSQYEGYDLNHDGIGDIPYRPVSLSSVIMENVDSSFILIKSFLLAMLDGIERNLPALIPEKMKDERPMMGPQVGIL